MQFSPLTALLTDWVSGPLTMSSGLRLYPAAFMGGGVVWVKGDSEKWPSLQTLCPTSPILTGVRSTFS